MPRLLKSQQRLLVTKPDEGGVVTQYKNTRHPSKISWVSTKRETPTYYGSTLKWDRPRLADFSPLRRRASFNCRSSDRLSHVAIKNKDAEQLFAAYEPPRSP